MAFCGKCGKEIDDEAKFCRYCGNKVEMINNAPISNAKSMLKEIDTEASKAENKEADNNPNASLMSENGIAVKKKRSKAPLIITVIVVILAGLLAAFWFFVESYDPTDGLEEVTKSQEEEIERMRPLRDEISERSEELEKKAEELLAEAGSMDY
jgi:uncharacterized membrane protein YvbJ